MTPPKNMTPPQNMTSPKKSLPLEIIIIIIVIFPPWGRTLSSGERCTKMSATTSGIVVSR